MEYKETDKMFDLICDQFHLLQMMSRFGIGLGFGEKSVREVCDQHGVDVPTFLAVANYLKNGREIAPYYVEKISVLALMGYLRQAHRYFLDFQLPTIRRKLISAIDCSTANEVAYLILKFYDEYMGDVRRHMQYEERQVFTYVDRLLAGELQGEDFRIAQFARSHVGIDKKLQELKNLILKYYSAPDAAELLNNVIFDVFNCEDDLRQHCHVEDDLFVPAVEAIEKRLAEGETLPSQVAPETAPAEQLSEREKEIVRSIVRGKSNKEVADELFISVNTVLTHRKNIFRKLSIHSVSGLTIYAIARGMVRLDEVKL